MIEEAAAHRPPERLNALANSTIAELMNIEESLVELLLSGEAEMTEDLVQRFLVQRFNDMCADLEGVDAFRNAPQVTENSVGHVIAVDIDGDGEMDLELPGLGIVSRGDASWADGMERKRIALRSARAVAVMTQFRLGMDYQETVAALGLVTQIELALVSFFGESVPEPGMPWDAERRAREVDKRLARLRWVERERANEYSGIRGMMNALKGKRRVSGKELYQRMVKEADVMLDLMKPGQRRLDIMSEVFRYTGMDHFTEATIIDDDDDD